MTTVAPLQARSRYLTPLLLCLLVPGVLALAACKGEDADAKGEGAAAKGPEAVPVEVAAVARRPIAASYTGTAPLEPRGESQVVAKTSGVALAVYAEEGQHVDAGQVLVKLDSARAQLQAAQSAAQVRKLESNYARSLKLAEQKLISANDIDQIKYDLENVRAANRLAKLELSYAAVKAPISSGTRPIRVRSATQVPNVTPTSLPTVRPATMPQKSGDATAAATASRESTTPALASTKIGTIT